MRDFKKTVLSRSFPIPKEQPTARDSRVASHAPVYGQRQAKASESGRTPPVSAGKPEPSQYWSHENEFGK